MLFFSPSDVLYEYFSAKKIVTKQVNKYRKYYLWGGLDINTKNPPKEAWEMVCLPKKEGVPGVLNLRTQNEALLLKNLHKFFNRFGIHRVHLIWERPKPYVNLRNL
jgi:hypothetical protein